jgi:NAD(P)-dependent dehydrogenase (short-subunit alcohol dehydrogenase family)
MTGLLDGKRALVTGCRGRLGPVWIKALQGAGAMVFYVDKEEYDLASLGDCDDLALDYPDIDILVNNAGVDSRPDMAPGLAQAMVDVNVLGTKRLCHEFGKAMAIRGSGVIINIASLYGLVAPDLRYYDHRPDGWVKDAVYGATKAAVISLTQYYAAALGPRGVRVNALAPGGVTAGKDALTTGDAEFARKYTNRIPMGRMCRVEDLAGPLVFLASDMSSFITGVTIPVSGGYEVW